MRKFRRFNIVVVDCNRDPVWNEKLFFDGYYNFNKVMTLDVLHDQKNNNPSMVQKHPSTLGELKFKLKDFVPKGEETLIFYTLQKKRFYQRVSGKIGLKLYYEDLEEKGEEALTSVLTCTSHKMNV
jgi:hypothetical protein